VDRLTALDEICFSCLRVKAPHVEHCHACNVCVENLHYHSSQLNKCVGAGNQRSTGLYLLSSFLFFALCLEQTLFESTTPGGYNETQASNWFYCLIELHVQALTTLNWSILLPLALSWMGTLWYGDRLFTWVFAASRGITITELREP
jgi:DHHC palmitoyltransferase